MFSTVRITEDQSPALAPRINAKDATRLWRTYESVSKNIEPLAGHRLSERYFRAATSSLPGLL
jgi:hypothetical protein